MYPVGPEEGTTQTFKTPAKANAPSRNVGGVGGVGPFHTQHDQTLERHMTTSNAIDQLKIDIIARTSLNGQLLIVLRMSAPNGKTAEKVFDLAKLNEDPRPLYKMAGGLSVAVARPSTKAALLEKYEKAADLARADEKLPTFIPAFRPGWHGDVYVTPRQIYGDQKRSVRPLFEGVPPALTCHIRGSLDDWKDTVGWMMEGNPLVIFAVCAALMPPLLRVLEQDQGCGFALIGKTRGGKTSLMSLLGSLYGGGDSQGPRLLHSLRVARNGLEPAAPFANDRVFLLDDAQNLPGDDKQKAVVLREAIFLLHGTRGKDRMGYEFSSLTWLLVFFICHNLEIWKTMSDGRQRHDEAAEKRLIEIPCKRKYVVFDELHGENGGAAFSDAMRRRSNRYYGAPFDAFITELTRQVNKDRDAVANWLDARVSSMRIHLKLTDADESVGKYFCFAYAAGRFAAEFCNFLPVDADELRESIAEIYRDHWRYVEVRPKAADLLAVLRRYIKTHHDSFHDERTGKLNTVKGQVLGHITDTAERKEYSFTPDQFAAAVTPSTIHTTCTELKAARLLLHDRDRNVTKRSIGAEREYVYCVSARILDT